MNKKIFEVPVELSLHGKIKIRADSERLAYRKAGELSTKEIKKYFKESFAFSKVMDKEDDDEPNRLLEKADGEENNDDLRSDG